MTNKTYPNRGGDVKYNDVLVAFTFTAVVIHSFLLLNTFTAEVFTFIAVVFTETSPTSAFNMSTIRSTF